MDKNNTPADLMKFNADVAALRPLAEHVLGDLRLHETLGLRKSDLDKLINGLTAIRDQINTGMFRQSRYSEPAMTYSREWELLTGTEADQVENSLPFTADDNPFVALVGER